MNTPIFRPISRVAALLCVLGTTGDLIAATATVSGQVNTDANNKPFFTGTWPGGYSGNVASNTSSTSNVSGSNFQKAGTATLNDLSDGNQIPLGVTIIYGVGFTVATTPTTGKLFDGGAGGLGVTNNAINPGEDLTLNNLAVTASFLDPLGLLQPGASITSSSFIGLRSPDQIDAGDSVTVSTDATQSDPQTFTPPNAIPTDFTNGVLTPRSSLFIKTNNGGWRLKGVEYQGTATFELAPHPATRRTFKFGDILAAYDGQPTHNITDGDTTVTITGIGTNAVLDSNEIGVGVNSDADNALSESAQRRLDGTLGESINITFDKKVSLESLTIHNYEQDGNEKAILSFISGTNPFTGQTGYSSDYTFGANSVEFKRTDTRGDTPYVITFGMGAQDDLIIEAGTTLSLTANPVSGNGLIMAMLTANVIDAAGVPGDYNNNGVVDAGDYVLWSKGGPLANEVDTPNTVNAADYTEWRARFGNPPGSGVTETAAIPEPVSIGVLAIAAMALALRRPSVR